MGIIIKNKLTKKMTNNKLNFMGLKRKKMKKKVNI